MIRRVTAFWGAAAGIAVAVLFTLSYQVQERERELDRLNRSILQSKEAIHVLRAEWAYLTRPDRLERLSVEHLALAPIPPERLLRIEDLPSRPEAPAATIADADPGPSAALSPVRAIDVRAVDVRAAPSSARGYAVR